MELGCQRFRESIALARTLGTQLNLAICEEALGNWVRAWTLLNELKLLLPAEDSRTPIAESHLEALDGKVARVTFELAEGSPEQTRAVASASGDIIEVGTTLAFLPGRHELLVSAPGHEPRRFVLDLAAGQELIEELSPGEPSAKSAPPSPAIRSSHSVRPVLSGELSPREVNQEPSTATRRWGVGLTALGAAGVTAGLVAGALALGEKQIVARECRAKADGRRACTDRGVEAGERGRRYLDIGTAAFVAGAVGAGIGASLLLWGDTSDQATLALGLTRERGEVVLSGTF